MPPGIRMERQSEVPSVQLTGSTLVTNLGSVIKASVYVVARRGLLGEGDVGQPVGADRREASNDLLGWLRTSLLRGVWRVDYFECHIRDKHDADDECEGKCDKSAGEDIC